MTFLLFILNSLNNIIYNNSLEWLNGQLTSLQTLNFCCSEMAVFQICFFVSCAFTKAHFPLPQGCFCKNNFETNFFQNEVSGFTIFWIYFLFSIFLFIICIYNIFLYITCQYVAVRFWVVCREFLIFFLSSSRLQWVSLRRIRQTSTDPLSIFSLPVKCSPYSHSYSPMKAYFLP